jgi:hypothetical protein
MWFFFNDITQMYYALKIVFVFFLIGNCRKKYFFKRQTYPRTQRRPCRNSLTQIPQNTNDDHAGMQTQCPSLHTKHKSASTVPHSVGCDKNKFIFYTFEGSTGWLLI